MVYLSVFRKINPGKEVDFWYQFPITNIYEKIVEKEVDENLVKVHYIPNNFNSFIQTSKFKEYFSELLGADAQKIFNEFDSFKFFEKIDVLTEIKDDRIKFLKTYSKSFEKYHIEQGMKDTKKNLGACLTLLKYVAAFKYGEKIGRYAQKEAFFFKEDLDEFEEFVDSNLKILNTSYDNKFTCNPIEDEKTCDQCDFKKICLKQKEVE